MVFCVNILQLLLHIFYLECIISTVFTFKMSFQICSVLHGLKIFCKWLLMYTYVLQYLLCVNANANKLIYKKQKLELKTSLSNLLHKLMFTHWNFWKFLLCSFDQSICDINTHIHIHQPNYRVASALFIVSLLMPNKSATDDARPPQFSLTCIHRLFIVLIVTSLETSRKSAPSIIFCLSIIYTLEKNSTIQTQILVW